MRCPKCGFISFDDLTSCSKCTSDLADLAEELRGTCTGAEVGFFLGAVVKALDMEPEAGYTTDYEAAPAKGFEESQEVDFDETSSGEISFTFDEGPTDRAEIPEQLSEDDVELELGEVLPLDLSQLETGKHFPVEEEADVTLETSVEEIGLDISDLHDDTEGELELGVPELDITDVPELDLEETAQFDLDTDVETPAADEEGYRLAGNLGEIDEELKSHAQQLHSVNLDNIDLTDLLPEQETDLLEDGEFDKTMDLSEMGDAADQTSEIKLTPEDIEGFAIEEGELAEQEIDLEGAAEALNSEAGSLDDLMVEDAAEDELESAAGGDGLIDLSTLVEDSVEEADDTQMLTSEIDLDQLSDEAGPDDVTQQLGIEALPDGELIAEEDELLIEPLEDMDDEVPEIQLVADDGEEYAEMPPEVPDLPETKD